MRAKKSWIAVIAVGVCVAGASHVLSQDKAGKAQEGMPEMSAEDMAHMAEYMKLMQPGEAHKHLHFYAGVWDTVTKVWMGGPGSEPMSSTGTSTFKSVLGGNWILEDHTGTMMGMPYLGMGMRRAQHECAGLPEDIHIVRKAPLAKQKPKILVA